MNKKIWFLVAVIVLYSVVCLFKSALCLEALRFFAMILLRVIPVLAIVFVIMVLTGVFWDARKLTTRVRGRDSFKSWLIAITGGIISSGPVYMWYPLLAQLRQKGVSYGFLACFMYNRAIKIPLLPLMLTYFSVGYIVVLTLVMLVMSIVQGVIINWIFPE